MSPVATRLGAFALVLVGAFGTAYAVGEKLPGHSHTGNTDDGHGHSHDSDGAISTLRVPTPSMDGYELVTDAITADQVTFHLTDPSSQRVTEFTEVHEADGHVMVLRPDLSGFQHLHPAFDTEGSFAVPIPGEGRWHMVVETTPKGRVDPVIVSTFVGTDTVPTQAPLPPAADEVQVATPAGDLVVRRDGLNFWVTDSTGAAPDGLEPYLGADAHLVVFRVSDLAYLHLHPMGEVPGMFMFQGNLPPAGTYRLFLQFAYRGEVVSVGFTVPAVPAEETA
ncbi:MAG TPA: hypothetical protein DCR14_01345 [Acidimicrobiaceae bacterium]|nr:hypothetical protein [Acidimicrobiaceae bacterium]